jgi:KUP system potassium uptake protein
VFWALVVIISVKYLVFVMRADNRGEGGILALGSLVKGRTKRGAALLASFAIFGTALLYGDGMITPAISVLAAVEGVHVATTALDDFVIPIAVVILTVLFLVQRRGTGGIGKVFGPIMLTWFATISVLGLHQIVQRPEVLEALNPVHAVTFFREYRGHGFLALGSIFLVVTGGEALYADMGHFGRHPIRVGWFAMVFPSLVLNYFGQGALLLEKPESIENPFFLLGPSWASWPLVILATMATVIASQALISGAFSLTVQAMRLDYLPRLDVRHTSAHHEGQVYVPIVNWILMVACLGLVVGFRSSKNLAAAYGIAVTMTMVITSILFMAFLREKWNWSWLKTLALGVPLLIIDSAFFLAQIPKVPHGGWFALGVGAAQFTLMTTWRTGRRLVASELKRGETPLRAYIDDLPDVGWERVPGTSVFLFKDEGATPPALMVNLRHNHVLHEQVLLLSVHTTDAPSVSESQRAAVDRVGPGIWQVTLTFGYMDEPNVPLALMRLADLGIEIDFESITYFLGRETVVSTPRRSMHPWREQLFVMQNRTAASAARFFRLPSNQVFEVGTTIEL